MIIHDHDRQKSQEEKENDKDNFLKKWAELIDRWVIIYCRTSQYQPKKEIEPIGLWGKRHARHLKEHYKVLYMNLLTSGKLHSYLAEVDKQAEDMFLRLVKEYADRQDSDGTIKER